jgi:hypothetical protein
MKFGARQAARRYNLLRMPYSMGLAPGAREATKSD